MGMNVGSSSGEAEPMMDVNTTPLIDVMLVLIVMMIITIPVQTHATKLDMPTHSDDTNKPKPTVFNIVIDSDNSIYWDGTPVTLIELEQHFRPYSNQPVELQPELHIRPDKWTKYDMVAQVLAAAQRNRMEKIGFVGNEQYM
jgi:biopolymer transport protein ExbD